MWTGQAGGGSGAQHRRPDPAIEEVGHSAAKLCSASAAGSHGHTAAHCAPPSLGWVLSAVTASARNPLQPGRKRLRNRWDGCWGNDHGAYLLVTAHVLIKTVRRLLAGNPNCQFGWCAGSGSLDG
ncbi:hypothetical protein GCM10009609_37890 [Pseudonocardia aurantiaca]